MNHNNEILNEFGEEKFVKIKAQVSIRDALRSGKCLPI